MKNTTTIILDATDRFYSAYKDSFGFLLLMHLAKNRNISLIDNYAGDGSDEICTINVESIETLSAGDARDWKSKGISSRSFVIDSVAEDSKEAVEILLQDLKEVVNNSGKEPILLWDTISILRSLDYDILGDEYSKLFQKAASRIYINSKPNLMWRPSELDVFLAELAEYKGGIMLNLGAEFGTLCKECGVDGSLYYGTVYNRKEWAAGYLYLLDLGITPEHYSYFENVMTKEPFITPEIIISSCGHCGILSMCGPNICGPEQLESTESFFLKKWFKDIAPSGKFVGMFDTDALDAFCKINFDKSLDDSETLDNFYQNGLSHEREFFLKYLETVVLLPKAISRKCHGPLVVMVFNKAKEEDAAINMIDCSSFYHQGVDGNIFDCNKAIMAIKEDSPAYVLPVSLFQIRQNEYKLNPKSYLHNPIGRMYVPKDCTVRRLRDMIEYYEGEIPANGTAKIIKVEPKTLDGKNYQYSFQNGSAKAMLTGECLVLCNVGSIRPVFLKIPDGETVGCSADYFAFRVRSEVDVNYLLVELNKEYVKQQIAIVQQKKKLLTISLKDLLSVEIVTPKTIEMQQAKYIEELEGRFERNAQEYVHAIETKAAIRHNEYMKDMHLRKHALSQVLNEFSSGFYRLNEVRLEHGGELTDSTIVSSRTRETIADRFAKLLTSMEKMQTMVSYLVEDKSLGEEEPVEIFVDSFLKDYVSNMVSDNFQPILAINVSVINELNSVGFSSEKANEKDKIAIMFPKKALTQILDNIVSNARKYGFVDQNSYKYNIRFASEIVLINDEPFVAIKVANNGSPLSNGMTAEKVFTWGECSTGGTGLGGWQIRNTARYFGGDAKLNTFNDDPNGYTVEYEIDIPILKQS